MPRPCRCAGRCGRDPGGLPERARDLVRAQLRIALGTGAVVLAVVTGLPVLLAVVPAIAGTTVLGVPLWWAVLAFGVQLLWIIVSRWQLGRAERAERDRARPVGRP
ncbi:MAG: divalent metal cation transporter [Actinomadura sp.]